MSKLTSKNCMMVVPRSRTLINFCRSMDFDVLLQAVLFTQVGVTAFIYARASALSSIIIAGLIDKLIEEAFGSATGRAIASTSSHSIYINWGSEFHDSTRLAPSGCGPSSHALNSPTKQGERFHR